MVQETWRAGEGVFHGPQEGRARVDMCRLGDTPLGFNVGKLL
jgi:hypothetical protein